MYRNKKKKTRGDTGTKKMRERERDEKRVIYVEMQTRQKQQLHRLCER